MALNRGKNRPKRTGEEIFGVCFEKMITLLLKYNQIKEGYGRLIFKNGEIYIGQFHNDIYNGKGVLYYKKNKEKYEGNY